MSNILVNQLIRLYQHYQMRANQLIVPTIENQAKEAMRFCFEAYDADAAAFRTFFSDVTIGGHSFDVGLQVIYFPVQAAEEDAQKIVEVACSQKLAKLLEIYMQEGLAIERNLPRMAFALWISCGQHVEIAQQCVQEADQQQVSAEIAEAITGWLSTCFFS